MPSVQLQGWIGVCLASPYPRDIGRHRVVMVQSVFRCTVKSVLRYVVSICCSRNARRRCWNGSFSPGIGGRILNVTRVTVTLTFDLLNPCTQLRSMSTFSYGIFVLYIYKHSYFAIAYSVRKAWELLRICYCYDMTGQAHKLFKPRCTILHAVRYNFFRTCDWHLE